MDAPVATGPREAAPPAEFDHEVGTWSWFVTATDQEYGKPDSRGKGLRIEVMTSGGRPFVCLDDGGDPLWLDEPRVRGLLLAIRFAYDRAWPGGDVDAR